MAVPAVSALRRAHPDAQIVWAVDPRCAAVLDTNRLVNFQFDVPRDRWKRDRVGIISQWRHFLRLREFNFDIGVDLQGHSKTALALRLSGAKERRAAYATDSFARLVNPLVKGDFGRLHRVERNMEALADAIRLDADYSPIMPGLTRLEGLPARYVAIHTGAGAIWKQWPIERWQSVAQKMPLPVVFLGGPTDPVPEADINLVGKLSLEDSMRAAAFAEAHLSGDTGSGHIAAAYGVPTLSIFGRTQPEVFRPYGANARVLRNGNETELVTVEDVIAEMAQMVRK